MDGTTVGQAAGARELSTMELRVRPDTAPADQVATIGSLATVLARVLDGAPPGARGWHPFGLADASGFAAMACDELLVHTSDAARGLELPFTPSPELSRATLGRLFRWAPADADPWQALLWANGRIDLPDRNARRAGAGTAPHWRSGTAPTRATAAEPILSPAGGAAAGAEGGVTRSATGAVLSVGHGTALCRRAGERGGSSQTR